MSIWQSIILGLIQGVTEFLPISSSGHLIIVGRAIGVDYMPLGFELLTHLATLLAVIIAMRSTVWGLVKKPFQKTNLLIIVATVPTVVMFLVFHNIFEDAFDGRWLAFCFLITAIFLFVSGIVKRKNERQELGVLDAAIIGIMQGFAGMPGISRSGITISSGKLLGLNQKTAANFSFLIAIPIILGASIWQFVSGGFSFDVTVWVAITGFIAAFVSGFIVVIFFLKLFSRMSLNGFVVYLVALSLFMVLNDFVLFLF